MMWKWKTIRRWLFGMSDKDKAAKAIVDHEFATTPEQFKNDREWTKRNAMVYLHLKFPKDTKEECEEQFNKWAP